MNEETREGYQPGPWWKFFHGCGLVLAWAGLIGLLVGISIVAWIRSGVG